MDQPALPTITAGPESQDRYWAFISYSHRDEHWAQWLHTCLETYRIPKSLRNRFAPLGSKAGSDRLFPVFRDRDELSGGADLNDLIQAALRQSRFLIVICSPDSAESKYVRQEIEAFKALGREDRVLCLVVAGEPGASTQPTSASRECFSPPLRARNVGGQLVACEPLAADVRKSKDGKTNAKLKIIAAMLGVTFDELSAEDQRRFQRRVRMTLALGLSTIALAMAYLIALDAGLGAPGGAGFRKWIDGHELSVMRPIPEEAVIRYEAAALRQRLVAWLEEARGGSNSYPANFDRSTQQPWAHNMAAFALLSLPPEAAALLKGGSAPLRSQFEKNFGEVGSQSTPDFWGLMTLARGFARLNDADALARIEKTERTLEEFLSPDEPGGWTLFLAPPKIRRADAYSTAMALMALLEVRRANLPWSGSIERRDGLIRASFDWLVQDFNAKANPPGWQAGTSSMGESADGLTLQIYGRLLDAEREVGLHIPQVIDREISRHLASVHGRTMKFLGGSGEFSSLALSESINFLWHPWAIDCATRWLNRSAGSPLSTQERVELQRLLGHLILNLGDAAIAEATIPGPKGWTFRASETLYGLSSIPLPK